ncbi:protein kinase domain-containing protein [Shouchella lehensis]|nr:protein kinase [Shouchella lehensis]
MNFGIENLEPIKMKSWHSGNMYFKGCLERKEVFIKTAKNHLLINNEYKALTLLKDKNNFPEVFEYNVEEKEAFIIIEFKNWHTLADVLSGTININKWQVIDIITDLQKIGEILRMYRIIHRDIRPENIMVTMKGNVQVILIDFAFSISKEHNLNEVCGNNEIKLLKGLGEKYKPSCLKWDDAYSINYIINELASKFELEFETKANLLSTDELCYEYKL